MKNLLAIVMMFMFVPLMSGARTIGLGGKATLTDVKMLDVTGVRVSLDDVAGDNGLLVLFSSNTCPFVLQWEGRYSDIKDFADKNKVGMIVLNSNHQSRNSVDSYAEMKKHAEEKGYNFYYAVDEDSRIANEYGGQTTPHAFLFDKNMQLVYKGAIDDNYKSADEVKQSWLKDAIASVGSGSGVKVAETRPLGCSIKRKTD